ncbi:MAG: putative Digeranylgeranylglyceryl phosphate synthase [Promethearchaeota archaeon]|nr:MAG: putative Digeranylgeranylglyceryl phosphate synthase [Candidatus Lokiarchaeota archaeon]
MKPKAAIEIMRPINDLMGCLTVIIGILNTRTGISTNELILNIILGILTYFFIAASGMIINDIYDVEIDRINRPERPIPRGDISLQEAKVLFGLTLSVGIAISFIHSIIMELMFINVIIAVFFGFIGFVYAKWGKKSGFLGNIIVSVSFSIGLIYGGILNGINIPLYIYFFFFTSFFLLLAREVVKGCEDVEGDTREGVKTLAITLGVRNALIFSIFFQVLAVGFFISPLFTNIINPWAFLISMIFGLFVVLVAIILSIISKLELKEFKRISLLLKLGAFLGLIAFVFASI